MSKKFEDKSAVELGKELRKHANELLGILLAGYLVLDIIFFIACTNKDIMSIFLPIAIAMFLLLPAWVAILSLIKSFAECFAKHMANVEELKLRTNAESQTSPEEKTNE